MQASMKSVNHTSKLLGTVWLLGTTLGSASAIAVWTLHLDGSVRHVANLFYMLALPGWIPIYAFGFSGVRDNPIGIVMANAFAWACWCVLIAAVLAVHGRFTRTSGAIDEGVVDPSRRVFLSRSVLGMGAIGAVVSPTYATLVEPWSIKVRRYTVPIRGLPNAFDGLRMVQFSDSHLGPRIPASFIRSAVEQTVALRPDLLLLTGDYIHDDVKDIDPVAQLCQPMIEAARFGAVGVLGNHDWWGDGPRMSRALADRGVLMIDNDRVWLDPVSMRLTSTPVDGGMAIVGLGDLTEDTIDFRCAFEDVGDLTPRIVLAHQPDTAEVHALTNPHGPRVDLMCSGHTHGGQVRIPLLGTPLVPSSYGSKYAGGLVQGPAFPVVVSRGIGMSLLPVRFGVPPEIVEVTLTRA